MSLPASRPAPGPSDTDPEVGGERALVDPGPLPGRRTLAHGDPPPPDGTTTLEQGPARPPRRRGGRGPTDVDPRPGHIPGLDGLRALAVIGVLLFHFLPATLPGGFLGVDVFFVVSGFLITTLLLREIDRSGRIDLPTFWRRRARRLLPPLLLVVVVSVSVARLVGGDLLVGIGRQTLGALTFTSNWLEIAAGASYFQSTSPILFVNFWSLAVEEQFYLLWPLTLVLVLACTRSTRQRLLAVGAVGLLSAVLMAGLFTAGEDATRVYYGTDTHLVGLMAGAVLALAWADPRHRAGLRTPRWRRARGWAVLGALLTLAALMRWSSDDSALTFRGGIALASLATVVLIAGLLESPSPWRRIMSLPPLTWVGERSYAIYLWHWPVLVIAGTLVPYAVGTTRATWVLLGALAVTLVLSELSLRLLERPVRRLGIRASVRALGAWLTTPWERSRTPRIVAGGLALLLVGTIVALATAPEKSATQRQIEESQARIGGSVDGSADGGAGDSDSSGAEQELPADLVRDSAGAGAAVGLVEEEAEQDAAEDGDDEGEGSPEDGTDGEQQADADGTEVRGSTFTPDEDGLLVPSGEQLIAIGDSLVVTSSDGLTFRFPGISFLAQSNRQWGDAEPVLVEALDSGSVRDNVVLHLGTNAGVDEDGLRAALEALGPDRNVVVMDLYVQSSFTAPSNETIREVVAEYPNAVVGEWNAAISERPEVLQTDQVHPDIDGMHVYAEVVARAFDELATAG